MSRPASPPPSDRRQELAEQATDHVLAHGLIGLSLRPLARAIGTSDRMLLYHFADKGDLVATVLRLANDRSVDGLAALPRSSGPSAAVHDLWAALSSSPLLGYVRVYVEASALGLLGEEPYAGVVAESNRSWYAALAAHLRESGVPDHLADRATGLVDACVLGLLLDLPLGERDAGHRERRTAVVADLAATVAALSEAPSGD
ncbi:TetR/AcrR family transcriptional regulator [Marmoricola endophyticus]|uniref:TetR/AcrR family transcriptional regulator n=1 Tax=Marmoricola endophyticus TaxID=2040280 RepID=UPI0016681410|nr:TetR/AcrR family transcriptional regulator [Marmoricola endophyticus]